MSRKQFQLPAKLQLTLIVITLTTLAVIVIETSFDNVLAQTSNDTTGTLREYQFVTQWGSLGTEPGQFDGQNNVAGTGEFIYVPDYYNQRIQKFTNDGQFIMMWGGSYGEADGEFANPHGVAIDTEGNVYVSERSGLRIQKFDSNGNFITKWGSEGTGDGQFQHLHDIAVGPGGSGENASQSGSNEFVYTTDAELFNVQKFTTDGTFVTKWGSEGTGDGQFASLESLDVDSHGNVYVADYDNNRIQKFTGDGEFILAWGVEGTQPGQFDGPAGLAVDSEDNVYVTDVNNHRVQKFTSNGESIVSWGSEGVGEGQFNQPEGIDVDPLGRVIVADTGNNRIQVFN